MKNITYATLKRKIIGLLSCFIVFAISNDLHADLVAHWKLDDNAGNTTVAETVGLSGNTGTATRNTILMHSRSGNVPYLDGSMTFNGTDNINCGNSSSLSNFTAKTVLLWVKASGQTGSSRYLYNDGSDTAPYGDYIKLHNTSDRVMILLITEASTQYHLFNYPLNEWTMVGYTWNGTTVTYYSNNVAVATDPLSGTLACAGNSGMFIGAVSATSGRFTGPIDDVRIYNSALTTSQIDAIYQSANTPHPVAHWKLDDNADNTTVTETVGLSGNTGTATRNTSLMHSESGKPPFLDGSITFNGTDNINCGNSSSMSNFTSKTVLLWMKSSGKTGSPRYLYNDGSESDPYGDYIKVDANTDRVVIAMRNSAGDAAQYHLFNFPLNEWTMVGYTWDGTTVTYYSNNVAVATDPLSGTLACAGNGGMFIGTVTATSGRFNGSIDDVQVYAGALTSTQIDEIYQMAISPHGTVILIK